MARRDGDRPALGPAPGGCGRCNQVGLAEVAVHFSDKVRVYMAHCTCNRGDYWRMRRADSTSDGNNGQPGLSVTEVAERWHRVPGVTRVFTFPSAAEKRLDLQAPRLSAESATRLRAVLDGLREATGQPPHPAAGDDWRDAL